MHPVLFTIGSFEIRSYGVVTAIAFFAAIYLAAMAGKKRGHNENDLLDLGLIIIIFAVIGARLLYVLVWWKYYAQNPVMIFKVWEGGLVFYGGLIAAFLGSIWWMKLKKLPVLKVIDIYMPFVAFGHAIARVGCFLNGCCYGRESEACGIIFPAVNEHTHYLPVQLYESAANFLNFLFLITYYRFVKGKPDGETGFLYFITYGVIRIIMERFRGDVERGTIFSVSTSTFISIILIAFGFAAIIFLRLKRQK